MQRPDPNERHPAPPRPWQPDVDDSVLWRTAHGEMEMNFRGNPTPHTAMLFNRRSGFQREVPLSEVFPLTAETA